MRIAVYGTGNYADRLLKTIDDADYNVEIVYFVESRKSKDYFAGKEVRNANEICFDDFDKLVIAYHNYYEIVSFLKKTRENFYVNKEKVESVISFLASVRYSAFEISPYKSIKLSCGLEYIYTKEDMVIGDSMAAFDLNFSESLIKTFFELTDKYYGEKERTGVFFDIGANIGTTSIYVKRLMNSNLKVIAIEPGKKNYEMLKVNCIINQCDDIMTENIGMGEKAGTGYFHYHPGNSGGSRISVGNNSSDEIVGIMALEQYCNEQGIEPDDIDYIWIDTEGFEAAILEGARGILHRHSVPLLQEYNPKDYNKRNQLERYFDTMSELYSSFIDVEEYVNRADVNADVSYPIGSLPDWTKNMGGGQADLFFF
jgi:FkbM family methyltransferase